ncbi:hypothetical protein [Pelagibacterium mangrovi]|uniref:hypothetical protein n=1 Tax=Pelagibacterium mangrovi TaxID=3119828 RepID=UPI002FCAFE29
MTETILHASASCSLLVKGREGRIFAFDTKTAEDGTALIADALARLAEAGCSTVLGPIGEDSWGSYRLVVESDSTPAFPGEPDTPLFFVDCFTANGFIPVAHYISTVDTAPQPSVRPAPADLAIGEWNRDNPEADMAAIHAIANSAFAAAPYFEPIGFDRFKAIHAPLLASLPSRYCLVGRDAASGEIVSCLLGYPSAAGLVLKSLMTMRPGAGSALVDEFYRRAIDDGQSRIVHALMHEDNRSTRMSSSRQGRVFRRYGLFGRDL